MTVTTPPRPPRSSDPVDRDELEALIEEARRRARRRRRVYGAVGAFPALIGVAVFAVFERTAKSQDPSSALSARSRLSAGAASSRIAFISAPRSASYGPENELRVMHADGSGQRVLTRDAWQEAVWSPDGRKIAFARGSRSCRAGVGCVGNTDLYVMNADGRLQRRLTRAPRDNSAPAWSPDGRKIAFLSTRDGNPEIYVMNPDGTEQRNLTRNPTEDRLVAWSPVRTK